MHSSMNLWIAMPIALLFLAETLWPVRARTRARHRRWPLNGALYLVHTLCVGSILRLVLGVPSYWVALHYADFGLLRHAPLAARWIGGLLALDFAFYCQHVLLHRSDFLWRFHRLHHSDLEVDFSTAGRSHPVEILFTSLAKTAVVLVVGVPATTVLAFETILEFSRFFVHTNVRVPAGIQRWVGLLWVTPPTHLVHHSCKRREGNSNFNAQLVLWDKLCGTYCPAPPDPTNPPWRLGLSEARKDPSPSLWHALIDPLRPTSFAQASTAAAADQAAHGGGRGLRTGP
jgi:sterol desaturase/sphingolipid hydroxylase (fatty acid hydroxylase superfamily)